MPVFYPTAIAICNLSLLPATFPTPKLYYTTNMDAPTDRDLILRARRGEAEAFGV
jgi:hypothetical protein